MIRLCESERLVPGSSLKEDAVFVEDETTTHVSSAFGTTIYAG